MNRVKKIMVLVLTMSMLLMNILSVLATPVTEDTIWSNSNTRMYATSITLDMDFIDGEVWMTCAVSGPLSATSISVLLILREENEAGNLVIAETWSDSATGSEFINEYSYSPAIEGKEYEVSVRVGIYNEDGLVGYDYKTISAVN